MKKVVPEKSWLIPEHAKRVFKGVIFDVYHWDQKMFDGSTETFEMLKRPDVVDIIAVMDQKLVIIHEQQPGGPAFYDIPGGRHDHDDEPHLEAAKRELLEETGMEFADWKLVEVQQLSHKIEAFCYVYLATDFISQEKQSLDAGEKIKIQLVSLEEYKQLHKEKKLRGYADLFHEVDTLEDILALPEFIGKEIEVN